MRIEFDRELVDHEMKSGCLVFLCIIENDIFSCLILSCKLSILFSAIFILPSGGNIRLTGLSDFHKQAGLAECFIPIEFTEEFSRIASC